MTDKEYEIHQNQVLNLCRERDKSDSAALLWKYFSFMLLFFISIRFFINSDKWEPDPEENKVTLIRSQWWGGKSIYDCEWRKDTDQTAEPSYGWCIKDQDGKWHIFVREKYE